VDQTVKLIASQPNVLSISSEEVFSEHNLFELTRSSGEWILATLLLTGQIEIQKFSFWIWTLIFDYSIIHKKEEML